MATKIRFARHDDIEVLVSFLAQLFSIEKDFTADAKKQKRGLLALINDFDRSAVLVAENAEEELLGMITGQLVYSTARGAFSVLVEDLFVVEPMRGKGVAPLLLNSLRSWGQIRGAQRMQLVADRTNARALIFYEKNGFSAGQMIGLYADISG